MDLSQIDDITQLKSLAYDQISAKEIAERNLDAINRRIIQVTGNSSVTTPETATTTTTIS